MKSRKAKKFVYGKEQLLRDFAVARKNVQICQESDKEYPLSNFAREEGREISLTAQKIEEYYKLLRDKILVSWEQTDDQIGLEKGVMLLCDEYDDIIAQLEKGNKVQESFEGAKLETYVIDKMCENFFALEKMQLCNVAYNAMTIEERINAYGPFGGLSNEEVCKIYIQCMIDLDAKHSLIGDSSEVLADNAKYYEMILQDDVKSLIVGAEHE